MRKLPISSGADRLTRSEIAPPRRDKQETAAYYQKIRETRKEAEASRPAPAVPGVAPPAPPATPGGGGMPDLAGDINLGGTTGSGEAKDVLKETAETNSSFLGAQRGAIEPGAMQPAPEALPQRPPWPEGTPDVAVSHPAATTVAVKAHPDYESAKAGDPAAAMRLVAATANEQLLDQIRATIGDHKPIIVPVHAVEATGRNQIGNAYGEWLSYRLGLPFESDIVQVNRAYHTGARGPERIVRRVEFDGPVEPGRDYFLADDFLGMGSTLADLRAHIEARGGRVIGASTLMASRGSGPLAATSAQLAALRAKYPDLEPWWREHFGHGFEGLTNAEAGYVHRSFKSADQVRDRLAAAGQAGVARLDAGATGEDEFGDGPPGRPGPAGGEGSGPGGRPARRGR
jgi:hypoxanthine-guanine phosphoribosyltransferase